MCGACVTCLCVGLQVLTHHLFPNFTSIFKSVVIAKLLEGAHVRRLITGAGAEEARALLLVTLEVVAVVGVEETGRGGGDGVALGVGHRSVLSWGCPLDN